MYVCFLEDRKNIIEKGIELSRNTNIIGEEVLYMTNHVYSARELGWSWMSKVSSNQLQNGESLKLIVSGGIHLFISLISGHF